MVFRKDWYGVTRMGTAEEHAAAFVKRMKLYGKCIQIRGQYIKKS